MDLGSSRLSAIIKSPPNSSTRLAGALSVTRFGVRDRWPCLKGQASDPLGGPMTARLFNALVGIWLFATGFMWPHTPAQKTVTIVAASLTFVLAILANFTSVARSLNPCVAILLFVMSTMSLPTLRLATLWNNTIVAIVILVVSLVDSGPEDVRRRGDIYGRD